MNTSETGLVSNSPAETREIARRFAAGLSGGDVVALVGELGAGKTCFAQGLGWGLGVDRSIYLASPTFNLVKEYGGRVRIYHMDLYRLGGLEELFMLGYQEYIDGDGVVIIEWADRIEEFALRDGGGESVIESLIPPRSFVVTMDMKDENRRQIRIRTGY